MGRPTANGTPLHVRLSPTANLALRTISEFDGLSLSDTVSRVFHAELHRRAGVDTLIPATDFAGAQALVEKMKASQRPL